MFKDLVLIIFLLYFYLVFKDAFLISVNQACLKLSVWKYTLKAYFDRNSAYVRGTDFSFLSYENTFELPDEVDGDSTLKWITV